MGNSVQRTVQLTAKVELPVDITLVCNGGLHLQFVWFQLNLPLRQGTHPLPPNYGAVRLSCICGARCSCSAQPAPHSSHIAHRTSHCALGQLGLRSEMPGGYLLFGFNLFK